MFLEWHDVALPVSITWLMFTFDWALSTVHCALTSLVQ